MAVLIINIVLITSKEITKHSNREKQNERHNKSRDRQGSKKQTEMTG
jgi:hypothetical protein